MYAPVIKKLTDNKDTFIERVLPVLGILYVKQGDLVKPFDRLGECVFSQKQNNYPPNFKPYKSKTPNTFYYTGSLMGHLGRTKIMAPFNGNLIKNEDGSFTMSETESKFVLLSGVWGVVDKLNDKKSVLIKTQTKNLVLAASTDTCVAGELVVFPNPMEILEKSYLENFSKSNEGKIIYVGHFASEELIKKAYEMGCPAIIAGSAHRDTFIYAKRLGLGLGLISGFGKLETPEPIYKLLSVVSYRFVFFQGERNILRIPFEALEESPVTKTRIAKAAKSWVKNVKIGTDILCLQTPFFGKIGSVDRVSESSIFVKFSVDKNPVEIYIPNFFVIE